MVLVRFLLLAVCQGVGSRLRVVILPALALALAAAAGAVVAAGGHPLQSALSAGAHLLADVGQLTSGGGPPDP